MKHKVAFRTLGCRLNQYETDALASQFREGGYEVVDFESAADVYVVNTCTVTGESDRKSRNVINRAVRSGQNPVVAVTGCMATHYRDELEKRDELTYVVDNDRKSGLFGLIDGHFKGEVLHPSHLKPDLFGYDAGRHTFHTRSMIKIQDGCDNMCTFCIVPHVRGRAVSRPAEKILKNIREVCDMGFKEIVLTGVNIGRYEDGGTDFELLVSRIVDLPGDFRVRISSIEPDGFGEVLFDLLQHPRMTPHLHLCLQSGSDRILRRMRRMYTLEAYRAMVDAIRQRIPDFNFTTDIIVGFPGESDEAFKQSLAAVKEIGFTHVHTFKYSIREGTRAARMDGQVAEDVKAARSETVRELSESNKLRYYESMLGKQQRVLVEKSENGVARGLGQHYIPVQITNSDLSENDLVDVTLERALVSPKAVCLASPQSNECLERP